LPGSLAASVEDRILFESVDIMPTIIGLLGAQPPASCQGESRAARLKGAESYADGGGGSAYIEAGYSHYYGPGLTFALVKGRYKFVARDSRWTIRPRHVKEFLQSLVAFLETGAASNELYDIESDPEERNNLIDELPAVAASLKTELSSTLARLENAGRIPVDQDRSDLDEQTLKSLKALGYIQ
jgi:arylsulfatase A-like enzyme